MKPHNFVTSSNQFLSSSFFNFIHYQDITLHAIQLYLEPYITNQYLIATFFVREKALDNNNSDEIDISFEFQLDLATD